MPGDSKLTTKLIMLKAINLAKSYKEREVVRDISLSIKRGEIVGLLGPNGAGKTTCFYMIVGLIKADSGAIFINENSLTSLPIHQRASFGLSYLPQDSSIFRTLSVEDNISAILETRRDLSGYERQRRLEALLNEFRIQHIRYNKGASLSGGERRRTEIARTLATDPQFILMDEPSMGLSPLLVSEVFSIIKKLNQELGKTILLVEQNAKLALNISSRSYIMESGKIVMEGLSSDLLNNEDVKEFYLGGGNENRKSFKDLKSYKRRKRWL